MSAPLQGFVEIGQTDLFSTKASASSDYSDYIPIFDANDLKAISENLDAKYILIKDIDLSSENWTPIGTESAPFTGIFDGNGNTISNLSISGTYANGAQIGLFGYANGAEFTNVKLKNVQINILGATASNAYLSIGPICGVIKNTIIDKCDTDGNIVCSAEKGNYVRVAGIVGESYSSSSITNCLSSCSLVGNAKSQNCMVGGITAWLGASSIAKCLFAGSINAGTSSTYVYCGGIGASGDCGISESVVLASEMNNNGISSAYGTSLNGYICWRNTSNNRVLTGISGNVTGLRGSGNSMITEEQAVNQNTYTDMDWDFNDIWFMDNGYPSLRHNATCENVPGEHFPEGYDFETDRWKFSNINETISLDYYIGLYEEQKGTELYNFRGEQTAHGHCFGMATSTSATLINAPYVTDYISWTGLPYTKLSSVNQGTMNIDMDISAKDYIKYCHIYQNSAYVARQRNSVSNSGINNVYNAVKNAALTNTDCTLIVIDLWGGSGGHTVYAAGIDGNDILVNDSNVRGKLQRIKINGDSWTYSAAGLHWDSSVDATINYVKNCIEPYLRLTWNIDVEGGNIPKDSDSSFLYTEESEMNGTNSYYSSYIEPIDTDKLLVVSESDSFAFDESESMYRVMFADGDTTDNTDGLYWLDSGDKINAENISDEEAILKLVGNEMKITAEMPVDSSAEMTVNENGTNKAIFDVKDDDKFSIAFTTLDDSKQFVETTLTGTANSDKVTATETEDGIQVTGLNNITVTYETADGTAETTAKVDDGSTVNITVNDDENTVETDWQCKHPDDNHDGICDTCSEDFTKSCSCNCHGNAFMQFIHKILCFLYRIFGMEQYRYCGCGKAHW